MMQQATIIDNDDNIVVHDSDDEGDNNNIETAAASSTTTKNLNENKFKQRLSTTTTETETAVTDDFNDDAVDKLDKEVANDKQQQQQSCFDKFIDDDEDDESISTSSSLKSSMKTMSVSLSSTLSEASNNTLSLTNEKSFKEKILSTTKNSDSNSKEELSLQSHSLKSLSLLSSLSSAINSTKSFSIDADEDDDNNQINDSSPNIIRLNGKSIEITNNRITRTKLNTVTIANAAACIDEKLFKLNRSNINDDSAKIKDNDSSYDDEISKSSCRCCLENDYNDDNDYNSEKMINCGSIEYLDGLTSLLINNDYNIKTILTIGFQFIISIVLWESMKLL